MSVRVERPTSKRAAPLVVEVPHAGLLMPPEVARTLRVSDVDLLRDADLFVDELFRDSTRHGAVLVRAECSRYVVDLNRFEHEIDPMAVPSVSPAGAPAPRGVLWRENSEGRAVLKRPLTAHEFDARLERYYRPYHRALAAELEALRARYGYVVLVCAHSMPSTGRPATGFPAVRRADVVPGTRGRSTAHAAVIDAVDMHFRAAGLSVRHDEPYRGGATTARWGRPHQGFHAVQVELNRALYLDERTHERRAEPMRWLASLCESLVARLADLPMRGS